MGEIYYKEPRGQPDKRPLFYGRHFVWIARCAVKISHELQLTDEQFLKLLALLIVELEKSNPRFKRSWFEASVRTFALEIKQEVPNGNEQVRD